MMETLSIAEREIGDPSLPVSSLHLLVPPLQLLSAAMWQVLQQQDVLHYGKLEEFVSLVMETFPELLSESQRTELTLGLQQFGTKTDPALEVLLWEFLSRLDQLLPVPDLTQTVSWLNAAPSVLEVCVQCVSYPDQLKTVLRHHRSLGQLDMNATLECKLSSMFRPPSQRAVNSSKLTNPNGQSESRTDCIICLSPTLTSSLNRCEDIEERRGRKTGYLMSGVQTDIRTNMKAEPEDWEDGVRDEEGQWKEEGKERDEQRKGCVTDQVKSEHGQQEGQALSTLTTSCLLKEPRVLIRRLEIANNSVPVSSPPRPVACESDEGERSPWRRHELSSLTENGSLMQNKGQVMTQKRNTIGQLERPLKLLPSSSENGIGAEASVTSPVISPTNQNTGQTVEVSSQVFACSQCPFLHTEEVNLHQHIEKVHPDVLSRTLGTSHKDCQSVINMSQVGNTGKEPVEDGPSVESENQEERLVARRLRIEERNRKALADDSQEEKQIKETRESQKQVEESEERMVKLQRDGTDLLTNIQVAADFRESQRRMEEDEARRQRIEKLESEAKTSLEKFEEITEKWTVARAKEIPQDLRDALVSQQQLCALLIEDKNKLINDLQDDLKTCDNLYVKDLKRQGEDVDLMIDRMEEQIKNLMKSYKEEYDKIENSFEKERADLLHRHRMEWEQKMKERRDKEVEYLMQRMKKVEESEMMLQKLRLDDAEECNAIKTKLDSEVQVLQQQVQQMKATYHLNQEKLEYNLHVLKKRDEENTITKTQQKRKITRLQGTLGNLKTRCTKQEKQAHEENQSITDDYKRIVQENKHREKKMKHFSAVDARKFEEIWLMNEAEVKGLVERALEMDRLVHEQYLGLPWERPSTAFMEHSGPVVPQLHASNPAPDLPSPSSSSSSTQPDTISVATVKRILELLCDEAGFLIDSKVVKLLAPLDKDEKNLIKLDIILSSIGIEREEDMYKLAEFFKKYGQQRKNREAAPEDGREGAMAGEFTAEHCKPRETKQQSKILSLDDRDESEDGIFWESAANIIPEAKLKLWDTLETALEKYHTVLNERAQLLEDTQHLKVQNEEMRLLLHKHCNSKINSELLLPPSKMIQISPE
ncbi:hypothetical protein SKAU_G00183720 [Synaphobranchus kaupii]|uniref:Dynein regulatory complex protein 1 n=1 Tax=Synaphobranchus kaupii TaxID=118154 RepID=A0A9Q1FC27_SYNKA|nr:hypothetical protein SKAU_G00183720 [Synaphobranchus kaupii]